MEFREIKINEEAAKELSKNTVDKLLKRIETQKVINQTSGFEENPFNFTYPSLYTNEILKNKETYILNFNGALLEGGGPNLNPVVHVFGLNFEILAWVRDKIISKLGPSTTAGYGDWVAYIGGGSVQLNDSDIFASMMAYFNAGSITGYFSVNASVDNPIISAFSIELKGASGAVTKNIATYFESYDMNLRTQHLKDPQTLSKDRGVIIVTQPQVMSINFIPVKK